MRLFQKFLLLSIIISSYFTFHSSHAKICYSQALGPHLANYQQWDENFFSHLRNLHNEVGADQSVPVTFMVSLDQAISGKGVEWANKANNNGFFPILRLNNLNQNQINAAAQALNSLPSNAVIVVGNEVNNPREWSDSPQSYSDLFNQFINAYSGSAKVAPAPLDPYNSDYPPENFLNQLPDQAFSNADAFVANVYQGIGDGLSAWQRMYQAYQLKGLPSGLPIYLTEYNLVPGQDNSLQAVANFIQTNPPPHPATILVRNVCPIGDQWLLPIISSDLQTIRFYTNNFQDVTDLNCQSSTSFDTYGSVSLYSSPRPGASQFVDLSCANANPYAEFDPFRPYPGSTCYADPDPSETEVLKYCNPPISFSLPITLSYLNNYCIPVANPSDPNTFSYSCPWAGSIERNLNEGQLPAVGRNLNNTTDIDDLINLRGSFMRNYIEGHTNIPEQKLNLQDELSLISPIQLLLPRTLPKNPKTNEENKLLIDALRDRMVRRALRGILHDFNPDYQTWNIDDGWDLLDDITYPAPVHDQKIGCVNQNGDRAACPSHRPVMMTETLCLNTNFGLNAEEINACHYLYGGRNQFTDHFSFTYNDNQGQPVTVSGTPHYHSQINGGSPASEWTLYDENGLWKKVPAFSNEDFLAQEQVYFLGSTYSHDVKIPHLMGLYESSALLAKIFRPSIPQDENSYLTQALVEPSSCQISSTDDYPLAGDGDTLHAKKLTLIPRASQTESFDFSYTFDPNNPPSPNQPLGAKNQGAAITTYFPRELAVMAFNLNSIFASRGPQAEYLDQDQQGIPGWQMPAIAYAKNQAYILDTEQESAFYIPYLGNLANKFSQYLQTFALSNASGIITNASSSGYNSNDINSAIQAASARHNVPASLLEAIFEPEGVYYRLGYPCEPNESGAQGPMQITPGAFNSVTLPEERSSINICNPGDAMEIAARIVKFKANQFDSSYTWDINKPTAGEISATDFNAIKYAAWGYYGSCQPDDLTQNRWGQNISYCDFVINYVGLCPTLSPTCDQE
jgi:hypothetical protein